MNGTRLSRRRFMQLGLSAAGASILVACAPKAAPAAEPTAEPAEATTVREPTAAVGEPTKAETEVKIIYADIIDDTRRPWTDYVIERVPEELPGTTFEVIQIEWGEYNPKINAMIAAGTPPDIWSEVGTNNFVDYSYNGMVQPVDEFVNALGTDLSDFFPQWIETAKVNGKLVGLPTFAGGTFLFYNAKMFDEAGIEMPPARWDTPEWTLDKLLADAQALTKEWGSFEKGQYGVQNDLAFEDECWLFGAEPWPTEAYRGIATETLVDSPGCIEAIQWFADLLCVHQVAPDPDALGALAQAGLGGLPGGRVAMQIQGAWGFASGIAIKDFPWGAAALPKGKTLKHGVYVDHMCVGRTCPNAETAFKVSVIMTSQEALKALCDGSLWILSRKSLLDYWADAVVNHGCNNSKQELIDCAMGSWQFGDLAPMNEIAGYSAKTWDVLVAGLQPIMNCQQQAAVVLPELKKAEDKALSELTFGGLPW